MKINNTILVLGFTILFVNPFNRCIAQAKSTPPAVTSSFSAMFPRAEHVEWMDKLDEYEVFFTADNVKCEAKFERDGKWLSTERQIPVDSIPKQIKDSLGTGLYSTWTVLKAFILVFPGSDPQYRICVSNPAALRKTLSFDQQGKLTKN
jgi:hypothetical protein